VIPKKQGKVKCALHTISVRQKTEHSVVVVVVVVLVVGPISTAAMRAYCTLTPPVEFRHSSPEAQHTKRRERPLLAKDGTKPKEI
jgi:hypothetical protein